MHEFVRRIENLLPENDCVIVPGLGGFVQNDTNAYYESSEQIFYPASKQIGFNAKLHFNDGLLAQSYQLDYGISFEEANARISSRVQELKNYLAQGKYLTLGQIGCMHRNEEGNILFRPFRNNPYDPSAYGLRSVHCAARSLAVSKNNENDFGRWLVAVAACLLLMLMLNTPQYQLYNKNFSLQEASVLSVCSLSNSAPLEGLASIDKTATRTTVLLPNDIPTSTVDKHQHSKTLEDNPAEKSKETARIVEMRTVLETENVTINTTPKYCIVVASFTNEADAQSWLESKKLRQEFPRAGLASKDGRTRVYVQGFDQRDQALHFLADFRASDQKYAKSWVLVN